jgi:hypothetical protein
LVHVPVVKGVAEGAFGAGCRGCSGYGRKALCSKLWQPVALGRVGVTGHGGSRYSSR